MKKLAMILCVLFIPAISSATPSIINVSGNFNHGNNITITGNGFGTKSPAKPLVWADFENLSVGQDVAQNSTYSTKSLWTKSGTGKVVVTSADLPHARSTKSVRGLGTNNVNITTTGVSGSTHIFAYTKRKWAHSDWFVNITAFKFFRLWSIPNGAIDPTVGYSNWVTPWNYPGGSRTGMVLAWGSITKTGVSMPKPPPTNTWNTEEYMTSKSTMNQADGIWKMWFNGKLVSNTTMKTRTTAYPDDWYAISIENFNHYSAQVSGGPTKADQHPPTGAYVYFDDVYIDSTWSRVMIGNASTYDACAHREPLIPTAWSNTSITAYFNQGSFSNGQSVYVFVVDSDGNASPGKAITIGGAAESNTQPINSSSTPNPPAKLSID